MNGRLRKAYEHQSEPESLDAHHTVMIAEIRTMISFHEYSLGYFSFIACFRVGEFVMVSHLLNWYDCTTSYMWSPQAPIFFRVAFD